jgi:hypothetical protein
MMYAAMEPEEVFRRFMANSGYAAVAAYAEQDPTGDDEADFDVVFVSNHIFDTYHVYSQECEITEHASFFMDPIGDEIIISGAGHESSWEDPWSESFVFGPVNAIFNWKSEQVAWTHYDDPGQSHHVWGDYEPRD